MFYVNRNDGQIYLARPSLNFEAQSEYAFNVTVTDQHGLSAAAPVRVAVTDANDAPVLLDGELRVLYENATNGTLASYADGRINGPICAFDEDAGQTTSFKITRGDPQGRFCLVRNSSSCVYIAFCGGDGRGATRLDFETAPFHTLELTATDSGAPARSTSAQVVVEVRDANDSPSFVGVSLSAQIASDSGRGAKVGKPLMARDEDEGHALSYAIISGNDGAVFRLEVDASDGGVAQLTVDTDDLAGANGGQRFYNLTVTATDEEGAVATGFMGVEVVAVNEPPVIHCRSMSVPETAKAGVSVGSLRAYDPDGDGSTVLVFSLLAEIPNYLSTKFYVLPTGTVQVRNSH